MVFLPKDPAEREICKARVNQIIAGENQKLLGWRDLDTQAEYAGIGPSALVAEPYIEMVFIEAAPGLDADAFERELYKIRKQASEQLRGEKEPAQREVEVLYLQLVDQGHCLQRHAHAQSGSAILSRLDRP